MTEQEKYLALTGLMKSPAWALFKEDLSKRIKDVEEIILENNKPNGNVVQYTEHDVNRFIRQNFLTLLTWAEDEANAYAPLKETNNTSY